MEGVIRLISQGPLVQEKEYTDPYVQDKLEKMYGKENCFRVTDFEYIVYSKKKFYIMKPTIPEIFFTDEAIEIKIDDLKKHWEYVGIEDWVKNVT